MKSNFEKIRSMLEYGHKVEVKTRSGDFIFIGIAGNGEFIEEKGELISRATTESAFSITPISHRYRKLEVGTLVDVVPDYDKKEDANFNVKNWIVKGYIHKGVLISPTDMKDLMYSVPLWAITPHVGEKRK